MPEKKDELTERLRLCQVKGCPAPPSPEDVNRFENAIGARLPEDYKSFLLKFGFTSSRGHLVAVDADDGTTSGTGVEVFYGVGSKDAYDLLEKRRMFADRLPFQFLAIAASTGGEICIGLIGEYAGRVYWWSSHQESADPFDDLDLIAEDFESFVRSLVCESDT